ncbi:hypothetical protein DPX39_090082000 [Trypanosoma brucei equiperdum]|uniref:Uncharacterized protein n=1 Tax=Trypanosoma brucei equiperdum TaxID=630700 RepID=A0A3L6L232_9TRYP|nr:hypothetical protein DPX39_090082000 [Trypanosoma brucei equiperdum]
MRRIMSPRVMCEVKFGSRPAPLACSRMFFIPPQLAKLIVTSGLLIVKAFLVAHQQEAKRLREEEEKEGHSATNAQVGTGSAALMTSSEALQILGLQPNMSVPLTAESDRQLATVRFEHLFAIATRCKNVFLQGKLSGAYRVCVDPEWDLKDEVKDSHGNSRGNDAMW